MTCIEEYTNTRKIVEGFTTRYNIDKLVYYEVCENAESAIVREKRIKSWSRKDKVALVNTMNKDWHDLYEEL